MNDSMSILLATTVLALGGLGLYVYRTNHEDQDGGDKSDPHDEDDGEESIFGSSNLFNWGSSEDRKKSEDKQKEKEQDVILDEDSEENELKPRKRNNVKTQRNRKASGSSRRRY